MSAFVPTGDTFNRITPNGCRYHGRALLTAWIEPYAMVRCLRNSTPDRYSSAVPVSR